MIYKNFSPAYLDNNIPIAIACDDNYAPFASALILSIISKININKNYDIVILYENLSLNNQRRILYLNMNYQNVSIRFFNMTSLIETNECKELTTLNYIKLSAYYRLFVGSVFKNFNKVIYLDSDIILNNDISILFETDMRSMVVAAVKDNFLSNPLNFTKKNGWEASFLKYATEVLKISNISNYFNSGVMLFDIKKINDNSFEKKFIEIAKLNNKFFHDQNVLNSVLQNNTHFLDKSWNFQTINIDVNYSNSFNLIHYCGKTKPWNTSAVPYDFYFWKYMRLSPFYESTLDSYLTKIRDNNDFNRRKYLKYKFLSSLFLNKFKNFRNKKNKYKAMIKET